MGNVFPNIKPLFSVVAVSLAALATNGALAQQQVSAPASPTAATATDALQSPPAGHVTDENIENTAGLCGVTQEEANEALRKISYEVGTFNAGFGEMVPYAKFYGINYKVNDKSINGLILNDTQLDVLAQKAAEQALLATINRSNQCLEEVVDVFAVTSAYREAMKQQVVPHDMRTIALKRIDNLLLPLKRLAAIATTATVIRSVDLPRARGNNRATQTPRATTTP